MTIYQIFVEGSCLGLDSRFTMHSKKVYKNYPNEKDINDFIQRCADKEYLFALDIEHEYKTKILSLELIEN